MARQVDDVNLSNRTARARLKQRRKPYWRTIDPGRHLGYYKGARGGLWVARLHVGDGEYRQIRIGNTDDALAADGVTTLSFAEAQQKALVWFVDAARIAVGLEPKSSGPYTISHAIKDYLAHYTERGGKGLRQTQDVIRAHIEPALGSVKVAALTAKRLRDWLHGLAAAPARRRTALGDEQRFRKTDSAVDLADATRRRRVTANRIWTVLRAALNHAFREGKVATDLSWRAVKPFRAVDQSALHYLLADEATRLVNATTPSFRPVVNAALLTGCRYGELIRLRASDFNPAAGTLTISTSKSGKARHVILTTEGVEFFAQATAGKSSAAFILVKQDGQPFGRGAQQNPMANACRIAKIEPPVSFHALRHTHASLLAMAGTPLAIIGQQLGHADTRMTSRYAHLAPSHVADTIRANFPNLGTVQPSNITALKPKAPAASAPKGGTVQPLVIGEAKHS